MTDLIQSLVDGVALGSLYALAALGIGLVFGVMRLINFAYGEVITAAAYTLLLTKDLNVGLRILLAVAVAVALSLVMEFVFRPLRVATPATMLITTFAVSFLLQNVAVLWFGTQGESIGFLSDLNRAFEIGGIRIRWITLVSILVGGAFLAAIAYLLDRTDIGLQMRAAASDFTTARLLGVRATRVIIFAFILSGVLAAVVAMMLAVQRPLATPTFGFFVVIPALVGVVVGGLDRLLSATIGGFVIGFATVMLSDLLPSQSRVFLNSVLFGLVIVVLLVKPNGLFLRGAATAERL
ncbi:MAG: branched-chain amino acid ABC transporter permease [Acidimicrobiia bacterium]|nr:branched-chain amino acid ABC transporter permease [Acidimicrobiia bacterium]NNF09640.1 branched-chain amino acid ABC transporter permease [Acidimicrobiia bacterium]NNL71719.1 branched-chain amino acid ABC transporter permease [Acidimicrobiia bacterium]